MALDKSILEKGIKDLQDNHPSKEDAPKKWAKLIFDYATGGMAGDTKPTFAGYPVALEAKIKTSMDAGELLIKLGTNVEPMWKSAIWASSTFTGVTAVVVGADLDSAMEKVGEQIKKGEKDPIIELAKEIDTWTKKIKVTLTNIQSGATSVVPLS